MKQILYRHKWLLAKGVFYATLTALLSVSLSFSMGIFVTAAAQGEFSDLWWHGCIALISIIGQFLTYIMEGKNRQVFVRSCICDVKMLVSQQVMSRYGNIPTSELIFLLEKKIPQLATDYWTPIVWIVSYSIQMLIASIGLLWLNWRLFVLFTLISLIPIILNPIFKSKSGIRKKELLDQISKSHMMTSEWVQSLSLIQMAKAQPFFLKKMSDSVAEIENLREKSTNWDYMLHRLALAVGMVAQMICMIIAALFIIDGIIPVGGLTTATQLSNYIFPSINYINSYSLLIKTTKPIRDEIEEYLHTFEVTGTKEAVTFSIVTEQLQIQRENHLIVYPNLVLPENHHYFIKGRSGIGKSTFFKILLQQEREYKGALRIGNVEARDLNVRLFYEKVAYLPQEIPIYQGTLEENVTYFESREVTADMAKLIEEFKLTHLKGKLLSSDTLSGGEKQRIGLIRALSQKKSLYLLDEPMNAIDESLQTIAWEHILALNGTVIVISHVYKESLLRQFHKVISF